MKKHIAAAVLITFLALTTTHLFAKNSKGGAMKSLVVYYSVTGNTELAAKTIAETLNADILKIEEVKQRSKNFIVLVFTVAFDAIKDKCSEIKPVNPDINKYDLIFIGSPVWAGKPAPAVNSFINQSDFKNKNVVAFVTLAGKDPAGAIASMKDKIEKKSGKIIGSFSVRAQKNKPEEIKQKTIDAISQYKTK